MQEIARIGCSTCQKPQTAHVETANQGIFRCLDCGSTRQYGGVAENWPLQGNRGGMLGWSETYEPTPVPRRGLI